MSKVNFPIVLGLSAGEGEGSATLRVNPEVAQGVQQQPDSNFGCFGTC